MKYCYVHNWSHVLFTQQFKAKVKTKTAITNINTKELNKYMDKYRYTDHKGT